jgi:hypothetical protein
MYVTEGHMHLAVDDVIASWIVRLKVITAIPLKV